MKIEYVCFTSLNGYSVAARQYALALSQQHDVRISPLDFHNTEKIDGAYYAKLKEMERRPKGRDRIQIYHCIPPMQNRRKERHRYQIGFATLETHPPPRHWIQILNKNDLVLAPSRFCLDLFRRAGVRAPILYFPHCIDTTLYNTDVKPMRQHERFTYMFIGAWKERKGYRELLKAWDEEFSSELVQLIIKTDKPKNARKYVRDNVKGRVIVEERTFSETEIPAFIKSADCLVLPTKGEGFGLPPLQAMALGIPVIVTAYSGCLEYATEETAWLIKSEGVIVHAHMDMIPQFMRKPWAYIPIAAIRKQLRNAYEQREISKQKAERARVLVEDRFSPKEILRRFDQIIEILTKKESHIV